MTTKNLLRWCVKSREGWCAVKRNKKPSESAFSVPTRCGYEINLPFGVEERVPTCPDCVRLLLPGTDWAKRFKAAAYGSTVREGLRREALCRAGDPVVVHRTDETGELVWAVALEADPEFWMDALPSAADTWTLIRTMGWSATWSSEYVPDEPVTTDDVVAALASKGWRLSNRGTGWWLTKIVPGYTRQTTLRVQDEVIKSLIERNLLRVDVPYTSAHAQLIGSNEPNHEPS